MTGQRVRVLHVLPSVQGYGAERQIIELLKSLSCDDIDAVLATIYDPPAGAQGELPFRVLSARRSGRRDVAFFGRLVEVIRSCSPDIVHTHTHVGKYWGRAAALAARVPHIVHTEHNPCDTRRTVLERLADFLLHRVTNRVITFFPEQGELLSRNEHLPGGKVTIIPNGLVLPEIHDAGAGNERAYTRGALGVEASQFAIMLIGRMELQKNQVLALRALAALPETVLRRCVLIFAGAGRDEPLLRGLARALAIEERVRFLGYRTDIQKLLGAADLVLMTSWFEGMPLTLIEAMIAGVPIVSTPWIGSSNMLGNGRYGVLTDGYEPADVAASLVFAISHPALRYEIACRAREHVYRDYGIARMIETHKRLYRELAARCAS